ncbi:MAG: oligosaccharide flippase family protein, partial [Dermatophilaceae bacterium]
MTEAKEPPEGAGFEKGARSLGTDLLRRMMVYAPSTAVPAGLLLVTSVVFTRIFPPAEYGMYSLVLVLATSIRMLVTTWLTQAIGRFLPRAQPGQDRRQVQDAVFLASAGTFLAEASIGVVAVALAGALLSVEWTVLLPGALAYLLTTSMFDVLLSTFAADARAQEYSLYKLFDSIATFVLRLLLVSSIVSMDIRLMFWSVAISNAVLLPIMWHRSGLRASSGCVSAFTSAANRRTASLLMAYGLPMTLWYVSLVIMDVSDRYVLNFLLGPGPVGIYDANYRLMVGLATLLIVPVTTTLHPYLMKIS